MSTEFYVVDEKENDEMTIGEMVSAIDNMTQMVLQSDFVNNFKKCAFGHYFNESFYAQSNWQSKFEKSTHVCGFTLLISFDFNDINFDIENNELADYARQYKGIEDIEELTFIFECAFHDVKLTQVERKEDFYIEVVSSVNSSTRRYNVADVESIEKLNSKLWNSPDYCTNVREKVIYFIFEDDYIIKKYEVSLEAVVKDYKGTQKIIQDYLLVEAMNKI